MTLHVPVVDLDGCDVSHAADGNEALLTFFAL